MTFLCLLNICLFAQDTITPQDSTENQGEKISFSWSKLTPDQTLKPHYEALNTASYGPQRFSIFEQLAEHHIKKSNIDSILHYANIYTKELNNWDGDEEDKRLRYIKAYYFLGTGNLLKGLLDKSIEWHIKGLQKADSTKFTEYQYKNRLGLAESNLAKANPDKAILLLSEAISGFGKDYPFISVRANMLLGRAYLRKDNFNKAKVYYDKSMEMAESFDNLEMKLTIGFEKGKLAEAQEDYDAAFRAYQDIRQEAQSEGYTALYLEGSLLLAKLLYKEEDYGAANIALTFAYINAVDHENLQFQREALSIQARCFAKLDDHKNAYAVMTQLFGVIQEINSKQQREIIKELEIQYETLEKEKAISSLEENQILREADLKREKTIKNAFLIGFLIILIPILALLYVYYQKIQAQSELAKKQKEINEQKVTTLKQEQELNLIKAAVVGQDEERKRIAQELHDSIGGNLAGIKLQLASLDNNKKRLKTISDQLDETYQLVRDISHTLIPKKFKQNAFTDLIRDYVQSISDTGELEVSFHPHPEETINTIDEKIQMELFKTVQELMTNTLKHAAATKVDVHLSLIDNELSLLFEDNGKGFDPTATPNGIGLENIRQRINELSGTIHIDAAPERGTVISIEIPTKTKTDEL